MTVPLRMPTEAELHALPPTVLLAIETLAPLLFRVFDRLEALEKQLADKGLGAPGTVTIDPAVVQFVKDYCWATEEKVDTIERECMRYRGVWKEGTAYARGSVVTRHGSMWIAEFGVEADERPGAASSNWKLTVKAEKRR